MNKRIVLEAVSNYFEVNEDLILGKSQRGNVCQARCIAMRIMRDECDMTPVDIGNVFDRGHSTVNHNIRNTENGCYKNANRQVSEILATIKGNLRSFQIECSGCAPLNIYFSYGDNQDHFGIYRNMTLS